MRTYNVKMADQKKEKLIADAKTNGEIANGTTKKNGYTNGVLTNGHSKSNGKVD